MSLSKVLAALALLPVLLIALQYGQRVRLDRSVAAFPIGTPMEEVVRQLGRPTGTMHKTFPETKTSTDTLTYGFGLPLALFSPQEWELEFADYKLIRKSLLVSP